jgi:hypothetical protein
MTIVVALLAVGIAFLNTTAVFIFLSIYAVFAILSGRQSRGSSTR